MSSTQPGRFRVEDTNDFFIDADTLSFSSLSRSSSLIQFESLERQLLDSSHQSGSFGGSTPSLYSVTSATGDTGSITNPSNSRPTSDHHPYLIEPIRISSRNYYDIEQIDFNRAPFLNGAASAAELMVAAATAPTAVQQLKAPPASLSSSSSATTAPQFQRLVAVAAGDGSSGSSSANSLLYSDGESSPPPIVVGSRNTQHQPQYRIIDIAPAATTATATPNGGQLRCKQSVENLSEDSGYGDPHQHQHVYGQLRQRSRSIPNFTHGDQRYLIAEEPTLQSLTHSATSGCDSSSDYWAADMMHKSLEHISSRNGSRASASHDTDNDVDRVDGGSGDRQRSQPPHGQSSHATATATPKIDDGEARVVAMRRGSSGSDYDHDGDCDHDVHSSSTTQRTAAEPAAAHISASLPDILEHISAFGDNGSFGDSYGRNQRTRTHSHQHYRHQRPQSRQPRQQARSQHRISVYASPPADRRQRTGGLHFRPDFSIVSSVPSCLNICITTTSSSDVDYADRAVLDGHSWNVSTSASANSTVRHGVVVAGVSKNTSVRRTAASTSVASRNLDLCDFDTARGTTTTKSKSQSSFGSTFETGAQPTSGKQLKVINASYSNLTVLDYSGRRPSAATAAIHTFRAMAEQRKQQQQLHRHIEENDMDDEDDVGAMSTHQQRPTPAPLQLCKGNFLLDEISAHFDRNLSILNDRNELSDAATDQLIDELSQSAAASTASAELQQQRPVAPPRRLHKPLVSKSATASASSSIIDLQPATYSYTFDRDPTNLVTAYAASLERCNFELNTSAPNVNEEPTLAAAATGSSGHQHQYHQQPKQPHLVPGKRHEIKVSSTPNLCLTETADGADDHHLVSAATPAVGHHHQHHQHAATGESFMHTTSTHTSLSALPSSAAASSASTDGGLQGILATIGSRNSLGKGVSFCPVVSEISWKEQSSEEYVADEVDDR